MNPLALLAALAVAAHANSPALAEKAARESENVALVERATGLTRSDLMGQGWTDHAIQSLAVAIQAAHEGLKAHRAEYPNPVSDAYGSGTMTNIDESFKAGIRAVTGDEEAKRSNYKRGCIATRGAVNGALASVADKTKGLARSDLFLGCVLEHHATVVYPDGVSWETAGVVLDGWINQSAEIDKIVFPIKSWKRRFPVHRMICSTNLE